MLPHLTASLEDYLEAIAELISCEGHAHTKEIAKKLNVKMPSVHSKKILYFRIERHRGRFRF